MTTQQAIPEPIQPGVLYTLADFLRLVGWKRYAMRTARENGLKVRRAGGRAYVHSDDFFAYLEKLDQEGN
ncbi:MAG: hypothetical protein KDA65_09215 [Planctomycetaceae bacterium]|nr:hypothetical protein [Planctomycetaceae bacterium]